MPNSRIILVEGIPGTGKSTLSQLIHRQLRASGKSSRWYHEEQAAHPTRLYYDRQRHLSWNDYIKDVVSRWREFGRALHASDQTAVLDAGLLQNHVRSMLIFNADRPAILELVRQVERQMAPLDPVLIYLKPEDVDSNFRKVVDVRGQRMLELWLEAHAHYPYTRRSPLSGYAAFIAFWEEFCEIADRIYERLAIAKLRPVVSSKPREACYHETLKSLQLPDPASPSAFSGLDRLAGKYRLTDDSTFPEILLEARSECLVASIDTPAMDVSRGPLGCFREVRLIPTEQKRFYVEAWPHQVEFVQGKTGAVVEMRVSVSEEGWERSSRVYARRGSDER